MKGFWLCTGERGLCLSGCMCRCLNLMERLTCVRGCDGVLAVCCAMRVCAWCEKRDVLEVLFVWDVCCDSISLLWFACCLYLLKLALELRRSSLLALGLAIKAYCCTVEAWGHWVFLLETTLCNQVW